MGPAEQAGSFKKIETTFTALEGKTDNGGFPLNAEDRSTYINAMQELRWPPSLIADTQQQALQWLVVLPRLPLRGS